MGELPEVEVVNDLVHQVTHVLHERHVAVDVARGAEPVENLQAEPMRRLDRGGVEVGDRLGQPVAPLLLLGAWHSGEDLQDLVVVGGLPSSQDVDQAVKGAHQPVSHSLAELACGHAGERDDEKAVDRQVGFGHVPCRQRRDREGLAGAGTRLEKRRSPRQRTADLERRNLLVPASHYLEQRHRSLILSNSNSPSHSKRA